MESREMTVRRIAIVAWSLERPGGQSAQAHALSIQLQKEGYAISFIPMDAPFPPGLRWVRRCPYVRTLLNQ